MPALTRRCCDSRPATRWIMLTTVAAREFTGGAFPQLVYEWIMHRLLLLIGCLFSSSVTVIAEQPNVLLICVDDLKPTLGCYGDAHAVTPNIDRLARRGVLFRSAYCNQAVCSPSRNSLITGLRPQTLGIYDLPTNFRIAAPHVTTLPQHFVNHGYEAQGLGKILHVGHGNTDDAKSWSVPFWRPKAPSYVLEESLAGLKKDKSGKVRGPATEAAAVSDETYSDGKIAREAVARLTVASQTPAKPFFIAVGFLKPHLPFVAPQQYWDLHDPQTLPMPTLHQPPKDAPSYAPTSYGELRNYADMFGRDANEQATTRHLIHGYYAATSYMDAQVGKVLDAVDDLGLAENTIIVFWGDHGWHLGDHGMWCKHTNYEQAARIPVIVVAPGAVQAASTPAMIETVDIFPTLCELAGIDAPDEGDGVSFSQVLDDPESDARPYVTHVYPRGKRLGRAIRDPRYRMVEWKNFSEPSAASEQAEVEYELYDYVADPQETQNLAAQRPEILASMQAELAKQAVPKPQVKAPAKAAAKKAGKATEKDRKPFDRDAAFKKRDSNHDGYLTLTEFLSPQPNDEAAAKRFPKFDKNEDGKLSAEEYVRNGNE
ncbi:Arylsulfatase [Allorhodopirellula heiligendammensis]|uniref:Arylsulfatase n=2 Tax=Allorhodopirellula heiligendammensis TaxID=2714739 RepID=A0A5C6BYT2_9BACT|nr:Arylsulfatase [Allorhodopirellula heiligendammensis]